MSSNLTTASICAIPRKETRREDNDNNMYGNEPVVSDWEDYELFLDEQEEKEPWWKHQDMNYMSSEGEVE